MDYIESIATLDQSRYQTESISANPDMFVYISLLCCRTGTSVPGVENIYDVILHDDKPSSSDSLSESCMVATTKFDVSSKDFK